MSKSKKISTVIKYFVKGAPVAPFRGFIAYLLALFFCGLALLVQKAIVPEESGMAFLAFFPAVTVVALLAGHGPALLALLISSILASYLFLPPYAAFPLSFTSQVIWANSIFWLTQLLVIFVVYLLSRQRQSLQTQDQQSTGEKHLLKALLDNVPDFAGFTLDAQGRILTWNSGAEKLSGYTLEEIVNVSYLCFYPPEQEANSHKRMLEKALSHGGYQFQTMQVRKNASQFLAEVMISAFFDDNQQLTGYVYMQRDISQRYRYQHDLTLIFQNMPLAILMVNSQGNISFFNTKAEQMFGYKASELLTKPLETIIPVRYRDLHKQHQAFYKSAPESRAMGLTKKPTGLRQNGQEFPVEVNLTSLDLHGEPQVVASIYDMSQQPQIQTQTQSPSAEATNESEAEAIRHARQVIAQAEQQFLADTKAKAKIKPVPKLEPIAKPADAQPIKPVVADASTPEIKSESATTALELAGFDLPETLAKLYGNQALLEKLLLGFADQYAGASAEIHYLLADQQTEKVAELLHRLKGAASNLGANALAIAADELKTEIRSHQAPQAKAIFDQLLTEALQAIRLAIQPVADKPLALTDIPSLSETISELSQYLKHHTLPDEQQYQLLLSNLRHYAASDKVNQLEQQLEKFEFNAALSTLAKIAN